jgi:hypothetical protein
MECGVSHPQNLLKSIGCGAFSNDDGWISAAVLRVLRLVSDQDFEVRMISYGSPTEARCAITAAWAAEGLAK